MKLIIDFENGMQLTLKPENLTLADDGTQCVIVTRTDTTIIPLFNFPTVRVATKEEVEARPKPAPAAAPVPPQTNAEVAAIGDAEAAAAKVKPVAEVPPLTPQPGL